MEILGKIAITSGVIFTALLVRYFGIAGAAWGYFYRWKRSKLASKKLQTRWPKPSDIRREISYSILTSFIFVGVALLVFNPIVKPYTQIYRDPLAYGWAYLPISWLVTIIIDDAYFYWMHRMLHHPRMFKKAHLIHHRSTNPTPFAALAFHPIEAFFEAFIIIILAFVLPLHGYTIMAFLLFMFIYNVYGHLGWELYSPRLQRSWLGRWLNTSTAHNHHHQYFTGNYGLYFLWWDKWMGTFKPEKTTPNPA